MYDVQIRSPLAGGICAPGLFAGKSSAGPKRKARHLNSALNQTYSYRALCGLRTRLGWTSLGGSIGISPIPRMLRRAVTYLRQDP